MMNRFGTISMGIILFFGLLGIWSSGAWAAENIRLPIVNANHIDAIPQQYIITLKTADQTASLDLQSAVRKRGGQILYQYDALNGFAAVMPHAALEFIRSSTAVAHLEADMVVRGMGNTVNPINWGLDRIGIPKKLPRDNQSRDKTDGTGVHVYMFDSGVNGDHAEFGGRVNMTYNLFDDGKTACGDHGTGVASIIGGATVGVANNVSLHSMRVLGCDLTGTISSIISVMEWLGENAQYPAIANMSMGSYDSTVYNTAVNHLIDAGIPVVAAAGNIYQYDACNISPGGADNVITVSAIDHRNKVGWFAATGACVELFAPGVNIYMAADETDTYQMLSGTSFATPHVTGCAAHYMQQNPTATPSELQQALVNAALRDVIVGDLVDTPNQLLNCVFEDLGENISESLSDVDYDNMIPTAVTLNDSAVNNPSQALFISLISILVVMTLVIIEQMD